LLTCPKESWFCGKRRIQREAGHAPNLIDEQAKYMEIPLLGAYIGWVI